MLSPTEQVAAANGVLAAAISNAMVGVFHQYTGRGPTRARTTITGDLVVCVMGATLTKGEQSLVEGGQQEAVLVGRRAYQDTMRADAISAVAELTGRQVLAFMSTNHIEPDLAVEIFILEHLDHQATEKADTAHRHNGPPPSTRDPGANGKLAR